MVFVRSVYFKNLHKLPGRQRRQILLLLKLFKRLSAHSQVFQTQVPIACPSGCGQCCENPKVHTTILEMLPVALAYWQKNQNDLTAEKLLTLPESGICKFYQADSQIPGSGRCSVYAFRPLICRLFGYSARKNKYDSLEFVTCTRLRNEFSKECHAVQIQIESGLSAPVMSDYDQRLLDIDPGLAKNKYQLIRLLNWHYRKFLWRWISSREVF